VRIIVSQDWRNPAAKISSHRGKETDQLLTFVLSPTEMQVTKYSSHSRRLATDKSSANAVVDL